MSDFLRILKQMSREVIGGRLQVQDDLLAIRGHYGTRKFHRHQTAGFQIGCLEFGDYKLPIVNLSLGGIMVETDPSLFTTIFQSGSRFKSRLHILGIYHHMVFSVAHIEPKIVGLRMDPQDKNDLKFIDSFVRFLNVGLVMQSLSKQRVNQFFQGPQWHSYGMEDESVELHLAIDSAGRLRDAKLSYFDNRRRDFCSFSKKGIHISCNPKRKLSTNDKKQILRNSLLILIGLRQVGRTNRLDDIIHAGIESLTKK